VQAEVATQATLETLAERIARGEARKLAAKLASELAPWVATETEAEAFDAEEFVRRVAERETLPEETVREHVRAVFIALWQAVGPEEMTDLEAELSMDYAPLLPHGPLPELLQAKSFYKRVAEREGLEPEEAWRATEAVLETLGERISRGEVEDLIARLALELHAPLKRGMERSGAHATKMSLEQFIERVASRAGVGDEQARDYTRGVLSTLREVVGEKEFFDMSSQLPREYLTSLFA
jgi:uncharacterized protein (DUF2267 family)